MRKRLSQADRRRTVARKAHSERKTRASMRTNPVLSKGHPQDVAHPATAKQAESDSETELYSVAYFSETAHSQLLQNWSLREESRQEVVKVENQTAPDAEKGWSRRRHASRQSSDGVRHNCKAKCLRSIHVRYIVIVIIIVHLYSTIRE